MFNFCTYFDQHYLARGLALYSSLRERCPEFRLWVLCMDDTTYRTLTELNLHGLCPIALEEFERNDEPLKTAKANRSKIEYYFTCTPSLLLYVFNHWPEVDLITYIDADLFFFASPAPLFEELGTNSIAIIGHRFPPYLKVLEQYGIYNVGWLSFRRDVNGLACLQWWRERCIEWCYDRLEAGRFADQKYLNDWTTRFRNVVVLEHKGANVALWNLGNYHLEYQNGNTVMVDKQPLLFFHFHGLKKNASWWYSPDWKSYSVAPSMLLRRRIYAPYIKTLVNVNRELLPASAMHTISELRRGGVNQYEKPVSGIRHALRRLRILPSLCRAILTGKHIFIINRHVI